MSLRPLLPLLVLALVMPASASTLEDATSGLVAYQFDGDGHHDAPDTCTDASAQWSLPLGSSTDGILAAPDDVSDVFLVDVPADLRGQRVQVSLSEATDVESLELTAFGPGCAGSVLEPVNWPTPEPAPPAPAEGQRQIEASNVAKPWHCSENESLFGIELVQGYAPAPSIHVAWTDGSELDVPLTYRHGAAHALYATDQALGTTVKGAWANMPADWSGWFSYVAGPCDAVDGEAVYGEPPVAGMGFLAFTPTLSGLHAVQVTYRDSAGVQLEPVPVATDAEAIPPEPTLDVDPSDGVRLEPPAPLAVPMSCHMCVDGLDDVVGELSYRLTALTALG